MRNSLVLRKIKDSEFVEIIWVLKISHLLDKINLNTTIQSNLFKVNSDLAELEILEKYKKITIIPPKNIKLKLKKNQDENFVPKISPTNKAVKINKREISRGWLKKIKDLNLAAYAKIVNFKIIYMLIEA